ncbi:MAG TPA: hypothetical protein DEV87_06085 [Clostridiales bacterium]|nr:hypothetical protein [Clostridiales bacterium]
MKIGVSTASLFGRYFTEDALKFLSDGGVETAEVFLETYREYTAEFGEILKKNKGKTEVHSVHTLTTQFEPQLYSLNVRAKEDSFGLLEGTMRAAEAVGAKCYTFHGTARLKRTPIKIDFDRIGGITNDIIKVCSSHGVTLAYENVHWCYYNYVGFFSELKKRVPALKGTLDIKQARQSGLGYEGFLSEMGKDIVTVHLSDIDENGKMCLPGKGTTDFYELFTRLSSVGFDGAMLIEAYKDDFDKDCELFESIDYLKNVAAKAFK